MPPSREHRDRGGAAHLYLYQYVFDLNCQKDIRIRLNLHNYQKDLRICLNLRDYRKDLRIRLNLHNYQKDDRIRLNLINQKVIHHNTHQSGTSLTGHTMRRQNNRNLIYRQHHSRTFHRDQRLHEPLARQINLQLPPLHIQRLTRSRLLFRQQLHRSRPPTTQLQVQGKWWLPQASFQRRERSILWLLASTRTASSTTLRLARPSARYDVHDTEKPPHKVDSSDSDWDDPPTATATSTRQGMTRSQLKARRILDLPQHEIQAYVAATEKGAKLWLDWGSIEPLNREEASKVFRDKILSKRVLRTRSCFWDKNKGVAPLKAKCRVVALGHRDPDVYHLTRECPTPNRTSEHVLFMILAAGSNKVRLYGTQMAWLGGRCVYRLPSRRSTKRRAAASPVHSTS